LYQFLLPSCTFQRRKLVLTLGGKWLLGYPTQVNDLEFAKQLVTVVIPEFVPESFTGHLLHNQTGNILRVRLRAKKDIVVMDVPFHVPG
jgi:hypothetical protein